ncbi:MAG TPA: methyl-accepting chemotaxis protein [Gemmatimonadaceae bacterium]|nr:methyl-accepting chemotaxis protein [Gemmatimonadaceae bacterium]
MAPHSQDFCMQWFRNLRTATKLIGAALVTTAILVTIGVTGIRNNARLADTIARLQGEELRGIASLKEASLALSYMNGELSKAVLETDADMIGFHGESLDAFEGSLQAQLARADSAVTDSLSRARLADVTTGYAGYRELADRVMALQRDEATRGEARSAALEASAVGQSLIDLMTEAATAKELLGQQAFEAGVIVQADARRTLIVLVLLGGALTLGVGLLVGRLVSGPLERTVTVLEAVAQGDLSQEVRVSSQDEIGRMGDALNTAIAAQRAAMARVQEASEAARVAAEREQAEADALRAKVDALLVVVSAAAEGDLAQRVPVRGTDAIGRVGDAFATLLADLRRSIGDIAGSVSSLSRASESLASVSEELSATAEETAAQARTVADTSEAVRSRVGEIRDGAGVVSERVQSIAGSATECADAASTAVRTAQRATGTISELEASSSQVGKVIDVIRSIARQTHLLSLNAAVEAARAGEAGAGFAVVAGEVKSLAERTTSATGEIGEVIGGIQQHAADAATAIAEITTAIERVDALQRLIVSAVDEHTQTVAGMSGSIDGADGATQQIVSGIDGVAVAARGTSDGADEVQRNAMQLATLAARLESLIARFRLEGEAADDEADASASLFPAITTGADEQAAGDEALAASDPAGRAPFATRS